MISLNRKLRVEQLDRKLRNLESLRTVEVPPKGWINAFRVTLNMSLAQLARRLKLTPASVNEIEERERDKSITLKKLAEVGDALGLSLVYGFLPKGTTVEEMIEKRAREVAREIVMETSHTMNLEGQGNSPERLERAIQSRAEVLKNELSKRLWD